MAKPTDSTKLPANHRQKVFSNGTLLISELNEASDGGQYACQAKSANAQVAPADSIAMNYVQINIIGK